MKTRNIHILNGDSLRSQLPDSVTGKRIVLREAFIEGPLATAIDESFWNLRSAFIGDGYGITTEEYAEKSKNELIQISQIERSATVNLWFEHDLFCQCNLWFAAYRLHERAFTGKAFLVLPIEKPGENPWLGFGNHSKDDLSMAFEQRLLLSPRELSLLAHCWVAYAKGFHAELESSLLTLKRILPKSADIFKAHIERLETPSRPIRTLSGIKEELNTENFAAAFPEFSQREGIYGFGDLQVMAMWKELNQKN